MKALFAGLGSMGQRHLRNLRAIAGADVQVSAYRARREVGVIQNGAVVPGSNVERDHNVRVFTDIGAALADEPDLVFVCNPSSLHLDIAQPAAEAGAHLFIEKPLSHTMDGAWALVDAVRTSGRVAMVGCNMRFHPLLQRVRDLLTANAIGRVVSARLAVGEYLPGWHPYEDYKTSYAAREALGGGAVLTLIHELDDAYWLFGAPRRVFAVGGRLSNLEIEAEDVASILMEVERDGVRIPVHVQMDYVQRPPSRTCDIIGDRGRIALDLTAQTLVVHGATGEITVNESAAGYDRNEMFMAEMQNFLESVRGVAKPLIPLEDGVAVLWMADAAKRSMATGEVVAFT